MSTNKRPAILVALCVFLLFVHRATGQEIPYQWEEVSRIVAVGDVHGAYENFVGVLENAGLIDDELRWTGGKTHLVQVGDVVDRGPDSQKCMELLMELEKQAEAQGGRVHVLIGNHEAMDMAGLLDFVTPEDFASYVDSGSEGRRLRAFLGYYGRLAEQAKERGEEPPSREEAQRAFEAKYPLGYVEHLLAFRPEGRYGKWILGHNVAVRIDGVLFSHGDWNLEMSSLGLEEVNRRIREELAGKISFEGGITFDEESPIQYRFFSKVPLERAAQEAQRPALEAILGKLGASRIVVGHTVTQTGTIEPRFGGEHISIDTGMLETYDGGHRIALEIQGDKFQAVHPEGKVPLPRYLDETTLGDYLRAVAAVDPANATVHLELAKLYRKSNRIGDAQSTLEELLPAKTPLPVRFWKMRGDLYALSHVEEKAREQYIAYVDALAARVDGDPQEAELATALARFCLDQSLKLELAAETVQKALKAHPHDQDLLLCQARLQMARGRYAEAARSLESLVADDGAGYESYYYLGLAQLRLDEKGKARQSFERALTVNPDGREAREALDRLTQP